MDNDWIKLSMIPLAAVSVAGNVYAVEYLTVEQAQKLMFGEDAVFERSDLIFDGAAKSAIAIASRVRVERDKQPLWKVFRGGNLAGYFIVDEVYGKHQFITYALALDPNGRVLQLEILVYRENYGHEVRNPAWRAQFEGKKPGDTFELGEEIKNISGATLSCQHITEGVKRLLATYNHYLGIDRPG